MNQKSLSNKSNNPGDLCKGKKSGCLRFLTIKTKSQRSQWTTELSRHFAKEGIETSNKRMERCSPLVMRQMQVKTTRSITCPLRVTGEKKNRENQCKKSTPRTQQNNVQKIPITWLHQEATVQLGWATPEHGSSPNRKEKECSFSIFCILH